MHKIIAVCMQRSFNNFDEKIMQKKYYIGIMSGTSLDAIDVVVAERTHQGFEFVAGDAPDLSPFLRAELLKICQDKQVGLQTLGEIDHQFALACAQAVNELLADNNIPADCILAMGSHGQTIYHDPIGKFPFTHQIGDANLIAAKTQIPCVADFRRMDMAYGGQGAPLVPSFHQALFSKKDETRIILNIGGIANISLLTSNTDVVGYDTGAGNMLMDDWIGKIQGKSFDKDGKFAKQGNVSIDLLKHLLDDTYFDLLPPKSTGREKFNLIYLEEKLSGFPDLLAEDIQRTLLEFTAQTIGDQIRLQSKSCAVYVCGGGALNPLLMSRLQNLLPEHIVTTTQTLNIDPMYVEAVAFAWLAEQRLLEQSIPLKSITGATKNAILGCVYLP